MYFIVALVVATYLFFSAYLALYSKRVSFILTVIDSLHITQVIVPKEILRGSDASIRCTYDLGGDRLYSVKWYKGQHEFFRFVPNELPMFRLFPWSNFSIDVSFDFVHLLNTLTDMKYSRDTKKKTK